MSYLPSRLLNGDAEVKIRPMFMRTNWLTTNNTFYNVQPTERVNTHLPETGLGQGPSVDMV